MGLLTRATNYVHDICDDSLVADSGIYAPAADRKSVV
jgi:hypothetical protein